MIRMTWSFLLKFHTSTFVYLSVVYSELQSNQIT